MKLKNERGVTLIEMLLVLVIVSVFVVMGIGYVQQRATNLRIDKTALQMQQILNAGLAYYVENGTWPEDMTTLTGSNSYFSTKPVNPWGGLDYTIGNTKRNFYVWTKIALSGVNASASAYAKVIAGKLPFGFVTDKENGSTPPTEGTCTGNTCYVAGYVTIPGQNLNNASAISFAGLYHHGGCVPVPTCPVDENGDTMTPSVFIVPVSVSGVNDAATGSTNVYPISSFTGYATGPSSEGGTPDACTGGDAVACGSDTEPASQKYWRACLDLITERGSLAGTGSGGTQWGQYVTLMALTRCSITNEPSGSPFSIYSN